jgi:Trk-type K+ transport system membrane component
VNVSLCGKFNTFGKLVICVMMIRGRHRGLPYQLDRAIMLPDEHLIERSASEDE